MRVHAVRQYVRTAPHRSTQRRLRPIRDFRARGTLTLVVLEQDQCTSCESAIDRFDRALFDVVGRCCACHHELESI